MSYCVLFCVLYRKESANKRYRNTVNNLISPNTVSQNDEKPHTAELDDTAIPYVKIKITEIPQYRKPPCPHRNGMQLRGTPPYLAPSSTQRAWFKFLPIVLHFLATDFRWPVIKRF